MHRDRSSACGASANRQRAALQPALPLIDEISGFLNRFPAPVSAQIFGTMLKGVDFVTSNVPGPPIDVYASGGRIDEIFGFGPLTGAAANITLFSYRGSCRIGVTTDPVAVPDPEVFRACLQAGLDQVVAVA
ncbi:MAG: WS/DGAT domain-containing protein [Candidatus Binatia bacterium]